MTTMNPQLQNSTSPTNMKSPTLSNKKISNNQNNINTIDSNNNLKQSQLFETRDFKRTKSLQQTLAQTQNKWKRSHSYANIPMSKPTPQWNASATTLRHSMKFTSFGKDTRFKTPQTNYYDHHKLEYPSTLHNRGTSFGYGQKIKVPEKFSNGISTETKACPFYQTTQTDIANERLNRVGGGKSSATLQRGKSFGLGWKHFQNSRTPHRNTVHSASQVKNSPGPQYYDAINSGKYQSPQGKMHQRLRMFTDLDAFAKKTDPSPQKYEVQQRLTKRQSRATAVGYGNKVDFTKQTRDNPGPVYNLSGFTDKFTKTKLKNIGVGKK